MIQGNFHRVIGAEAIGSSGDHSDFVVQALDGAAGDFALGLEPVQEQFLMGASIRATFFIGSMRLRKARQVQ